MEKAGAIPVARTLTTGKTERRTVMSEACLPFKFELLVQDESGMRLSSCLSDEIPFVGTSLTVQDHPRRVVSTEQVGAQKVASGFRIQPVEVVVEDRVFVA